MSRLLRTIFVLTCVALACRLSRAQSPSAFQDLPRDNWAYKALGRLQDAGFLPGYPMGQFSGMRTLTRYEIALAVDRAAKSIPTLRVGSASDSPISLHEATADEMASLKRLVRDFRQELLSQGYSQPGIAGLETKIDQEL